MCQTTYESEALNTSELKKMWSIFNRVCLPDSYPPVVTKDDADWLFSKIARSLDKTWYVMFMYSYGTCTYSLIHMMYMYMNELKLLTYFDVHLN